MITLFRYFLYKSKKTKWELALWQFIDKQIVEIIEDPEELAKKFMPYLTELIHKTNNTDS